MTQQTLQLSPPPASNSSSSLGAHKGLGTQEGERNEGECHGADDCHTPSGVGCAAAVGQVPVFWAADSPGAHGSEISFGSCGAAGFASAAGSVGSKAVGVSSKAGNVAAGSVSSKAGNVAAGSVSSKTAASAALGAPARASSKAPVRDVVAEDAPVAGIDVQATQPVEGSGVGGEQHDSRPVEQHDAPQHSTAQHTPTASAQFATPMDRAGYAAFMTPLSGGGASFHTGTSAFPSSVSNRR